VSWRLTATAEADLNSILQFIATHDGTARAVHVLDAFAEAFEAIATTPGLGAIKTDLTGADVRWWRVFSFLIMYQSGEADVIVLRIIHGARDLDRVLDTET